jgi:1-acyl-sn-glycerol-3-phosphate acyltransferase
MDTPSIKYPRFVIRRTLMRWTSLLLVRVLTRLTVTGRENLPKNGPLILAGNHVSALEAVILVGLILKQVEFMGTGDIPLDPAYAWIVNAYGLIPVNRGNLDREALHACMEVLRQDGFLAIFPEGGIWDPAHMQAQLGIALVSERATAPVLPIGFGGLKSAFGAVLKLKRPRIVVNFGKVIEPVTIRDGEGDRKTQLQVAANHILASIHALLPSDEKQAGNQDFETTYELMIQVLDAGQEVIIPDELQVSAGDAFARLMYTPVLLDTLYRNLKLPLAPLAQLAPVGDVVGFLHALRSITAYLETNPGFFTYRYGMEEGLRVAQALEQLTRLAEWAMRWGYSLRLLPQRQVLNKATGEVQTHTDGELPRSLKG